MLSGKRILLGIGGGIAAYRTAELARMLHRAGAVVRTVMTPAACEFITPMTLEALTGEPVHTRMFDLTAEREMGHIRLARWADVLLVAPATADLLAKFAYGVCDNLLTTLFQVCEAPVLVAPAMNVSMWQAPAVRRNVATLGEQGVHFAGPDAGPLACGEVGPGRMREPEAIVARLEALLSEQSLRGQRWVVNAGPTWEAWDDVRILSNRASGSFGALLADVAAMHGARVTLVAGPRVPACRQEGIRRVDVESADEMRAACCDAAAGADVFVGTAAVGDYRFAETTRGKLKRGEHQGEIQVRLVQNADIVADIARGSARPALVVALAAEAADHVRHAEEKRRAKGADAIFVNDISSMGGRDGGGWWLDGGEPRESGRMDKAQLARWMIERIREMQHG